jgi:hypothetical protein
MRVLLALILMAACGKPANDKKPADDKKSADDKKAAPAAAAAKAKDIKACDLTSAAEIGTIFGKRVAPAAAVDASLCSFILDPAERQKSVDALISGDAKSLEQLQVMVGLAHDDASEEDVKSANEQFRNAVTSTVPPGTKAQITHAVTEVPGVADWAFISDASVALSGIGGAGRVFDARVGAWRVTLTATVSPDPGKARVDAELMTFARAVVAKLKAYGGAASS